MGFTRAIPAELPSLLDSPDCCRMVRNYFFNRNRRTEAPKTAAPQTTRSSVEQSDFGALGQNLQQELQRLVAQANRLQIRCAIREGILLVLTEHLLHVEPDPQQTFIILEQSVRELVPNLLLSDPTCSPTVHSRPLPVRVYLRVAGYQQPYAFHSFDLEPTSQAWTLGDVKNPPHTVALVEPIPAWSEPTVSPAPESIAPSPEPQTTPEPETPETVEAFSLVTDAEPETFPETATDESPPPNALETESLDAGADSPAANVLAQELALPTPEISADSIALPEPIFEPTAIVAEPFEQPTHKLVEAPVVEPIEDLIEQPFEKPTYELVEEPTYELVEQPIDELEEPIEQPIEEPTYELIEESTDRPLEEPTYELVMEPIEELTEEPVEEPSYESIEELSVGQPIDQPIEQPVTEPSDQPIHEPIAENNSAELAEPIARSAPDANFTIITDADAFFAESISDESEPVLDEPVTDTLPEQDELELTSTEVEPAENAQEHEAAANITASPLLEIQFLPQESEIPTLEEPAAEFENDLPVEPVAPELTPIAEQQQFLEPVVQPSSEVLEPEVIAELTAEPIAEDLVAEEQEEPVIEEPVAEEQESAIEDPVTEEQTTPFDREVDFVDESVQISEPIAEPSNQEPIVVISHELAPAEPASPSILDGISTEPDSEQIDSIPSEDVWSDTTVDSDTVDSDPDITSTSILETVVELPAEPTSEPTLEPSDVFPTTLIEDDATAVAESIDDFEYTTIADLEIPDVVEYGPFQEIEQDNLDEYLDESPIADSGVDSYEPVGSDEAIDEIDSQFNAEIAEQPESNEVELVSQDFTAQNEDIEFGQEALNQESDQSIAAQFQPEPETTEDVATDWTDIDGSETALSETEIDAEIDAEVKATTAREPVHEPSNHPTSQPGATHHIPDPPVETPVEVVSATETNIRPIRLIPAAQDSASSFDRLPLDLGDTGKKPWRSRLTLSNVLLTGAVGLFFVVGGVYIITRPCALGGTCEPLQRAQQLSQRALTTLQANPSALEVVDAYDQLTQANQLLETIPIWSSAHQDAQTLMTEYSGKVEELSLVVQALNQANVAAKKSLNPPHPIQVWREVQWTWREAIGLLEKVPSESSVYALAQNKRSEYQSNLESINSRMIVEQNALDRLEAVKKAAEVTDARSQIVNTIESWQQTSDSWQAILDQLKQIPQGTMAYQEAQRLSRLYQLKLEDAETRRSQENRSVEAYNQAVALAEQAGRLEQQGQWSQAIDSWRQAITTIKQVPEATTYHDQAQTLLNSYLASLNQSEQNVRQITLVQTIEPQLERVCSGNYDLCTYTLTTEAIRVQLTAEYDQIVVQALRTAQFNNGSSNQTATRVNQFVQSLGDISRTAQVPVELYSAAGIKLGTYSQGQSSFVTP